MNTMIRRITALTAVAVLGLTGAACSDEDGDGATTDEEVGELDDSLDDAGNELGEEVDEGQNEVEGEGE